ncbi:hypothetical protein HY383_01630 [Candidatus Daviesbacteria bacterium]|nr:hypothetical protein [Candidatus Daviesbacteria bacterium]
MPKKSNSQQGHLLILLLLVIGVAAVLVFLGSKYKNLFSKGSVAGTTSVLNVSGIFPSLAMFGDARNAEPECCNETGIGALVNWAGRLWAV